MTSQWQNLFLNLGEWQGSFTRFSPQGKELEDIPSVVSFEGLNNNSTMRQVVKLSPVGQPIQEKVLEYSSLNKNILLFDNGAFSFGSLQWSPFSEFGAELGLIEGNERLRLVQLFNRDSQLDKLTLIRETKVGTEKKERPPLRVDSLVGEWKGEAVTLYLDGTPPKNYSTALKIKIQGESLEQELTFAGRTLASQARITDSTLHFESGHLPIQILLLPNGVSCNCPTTIKAGFPFVLEVGWLLQPHYRQRLIRSYNAQGEWESFTLVQEHKQELTSP